MDSVITNECSICLELSNHDYVLTCKHSFCFKCIEHALNIKSQCPICRRVSCIQIKIGELEGQYWNSKQNFIRTQEQQKSSSSVETDTSFQNATGASDYPIPIIIYENMLQLNQEVEFNFFEKEYIKMINKCLNGNLRLGMIEEELDDQCQILEIMKIRKQRINNNDYYNCILKCVERGVIKQNYHEEEIQDLDEDAEEHYFFGEVEIIEDSVEQHHNQNIVLYYQIWQLAQEISEFKTINQIDLPELDGIRNTKEQQKIMSQKSLELLPLFNIAKMKMRQLYFSKNLNQRLQVIMKHMSVIKTMFEHKQKQGK